MVRYFIKIEPMRCEKSIAPKYVGTVTLQMAIAPKWTYSKSGRWSSFGNTGLKEF